MIITSWGDFFYITGEDDELYTGRLFWDSSSGFKHPQALIKNTIVEGEYWWKNE